MIAADLLPRANPAPERSAAAGNLWTIAAVRSLKTVEDFVAVDS